jgi:hypothetical protein
MMEGHCVIGEFASMPKDRRQERRIDTDRRTSARWRTNKRIQWRSNRGQKTRNGLIKERSLNGLLILVEKGTKPLPGSRIRISPEMTERLGCKTAIVRRIENEFARTFEFVAEIES